MNGLDVGVLGHAWALFVTAFILVTYLGVGITALALPSSLKSVGWLLTPYLGYSVLACISAAMVMLGANVRVSLVASLIVATVANGWALRSDRGPRSLGSIKWLWAQCAMAIPLYAIPAFSMAHNGSTAYVGGQEDLTYVMPVVEWLKDHFGGPLSFNSGSLVNPYSIGNPAPLGGWDSFGTNPGYGYPVPADAQVTFQRGLVYLQAALGIILNWDSFLVYRPAMAFMLSISPPAVFLFCRQLLKASFRASLLAALFVGLNGSLFFWVGFGHLGQTVALPLLPVSLAVAISAMESPERRAVLPPALLLSALLVSYYQAITPILAVLLLPTATYILARSGGRRSVIGQIALMGVGVLIIAIPEHVKLLLSWRANSIVQVFGWSEPDFAALSDALGTTLMRRVLELVMGQGQVGEPLLSLYYAVTTTATIVAAMIALVGVFRHTAEKIALHRVMLVGAAGLLEYLVVTGYTYGYAKALAAVTFLFAVSLGLGMDYLWRRVEDKSLPYAMRLHRRVAEGRAASYVIVAGVLLMCGVMAGNLALSAYGFWKPVGNRWDPRAWGASTVTGTLPPEAITRISPNILAAPESIVTTLYFLRSQVLEGTFSLEGILGKKVVSVPPGPTTLEGSGAVRRFELLGASEIAAGRGLTPSDQVWSGSIVKVYQRDRKQQEATLVKLPSGAALLLPERLPVAVEMPAGTRSGYLMLVFASDAPTTIETISHQSSVISRSPQPSPKGAGGNGDGSPSARGGFGHTSPERTQQEGQSLQIGPGVSVRTVPIEAGESVELSASGGERVELLTATVRTDDGDPPPAEDYPKVMAAVGHSSLSGNVITTDFSYLDTGVLAYHSLDIYHANGNSHRAWFELPTAPGDQLRDVRFEFNAVTLDHRSSLDGADTSSRPFSIQPWSDGDYVACFSIWTVRSLVKSIPLYRYRVEDGKVTSFESFDLTGVWDARAVGDVGTE